MTKIYLSKTFLLLICLIIPFCSLAQALKIMPLGNSLTQADKDNLSYRYHLWKKLLDAEANIDFIGSQQSNHGGSPTWPSYKGKSFDQNHEGHWGWTSDHILNGVDNGENAGSLPIWLNTHKPDIVLLHLGSNDMFRNGSVTETADRLKEVVRLLRQTNAGVIILMAKLFPADPSVVGQQEAQKIPLLNAEIDKLAKELHTSKSPVVLVDQHTGIDPKSGADTYDGVHPNEAGEEKMAARWFKALQPFLNGKPLSAKPEQNASGLVVYPTLTQSQPVTISMELLKPNEQVSLEVHTTDGRLVAQHTILADASGNLTHVLETGSNRVAGLYIVRASSASKTYTAKFMVHP
ncbi:GDSL-type esterase/lipase family protein [Pontibacter sp. 13R65]|uniref:GDSL-type esterase/lipase family protein n=1 Tax=Pontibacter sp. 13R65 TaxID=3127458 RepID=UPI00301C470B